ncbi:PIN domain-containing protein [Glacieibacterium megasporae]|uniref:PIN domain-containing protein n=1 Tax=Glacieibacterium megasporae TaxID=2835787 RepID=UPI001C1E705A|nr:PIN domain-containing protein [Polymorphobacter megasporae]UAJ11163.1 PIN domain-containing protein [Polymorphobacter megasporae]
MVLDTDAVVAAMRSPTGGSAALVRAARRGEVVLTATVPLAIEYEAVCSRAEHVVAAGFSPGDLMVFLDALVGLLEPADVWFLWRPQLRDPGDELVLEAAVNGRAAAIVGFNRRDFGVAPARFGITFMTPGEALRRLI